MVNADLDRTVALRLAPGTALGKLIQRQHGVVARRQLLATGATRRQLDHAMRVGMLLPTQHRAVYAVGYSTSLEARHMAAVLAAGQGAVLSHVSAAAQWGLCDPPAATDVTRPGRSDRLPGLRIHHGELRRDEWQLLDSIPVTTVARLLLDVAGVEGRRALERIYAAADRGGLLRHDRVRELVDRHPGRRGVRILRELHAARDPARRPGRSELERIALKLFTEAGMPPTRTNAIVAGREVDMIWDDARTMVELDGRKYHSGDEMFEADRSRDLEMGALGYRIVRITWAMLRDQPEAVVIHLRKILSRSP